MSYQSPASGVGIDPSEFAAILHRAIENGPEVLYEYCTDPGAGPNESLARLVLVGATFVLIVHRELGDSPSVDDCVTYAQATARRGSSDDGSFNVLTAEALIRASYGSMPLLRNIAVGQLLGTMSGITFLALRDRYTESIQQLAMEVGEFVSTSADTIARILVEEMDKL